jgi:dipeptidyl aminopeptidase/acylaminoacyl peptidase
VLYSRPRSSASAAAVAGSAVSYDAVCVARGHVWWLESRPDEGGRVALMRSDGAGRPIEVTPHEANVGNDIHAYGGGAYAVDDHRVWYVDRRDGLINCIEHDGSVRAVADSHAGGAMFGDLACVAGGLLFIQEHTDGDDLVGLDWAGTAHVLLRTDGFLGAPRARDGRIAWLSWDVDRMPWDATELWVAPLRSNDLGPAAMIAGGGQESIVEPQWDAEGRLTFLSDRTGWWNLYRWDDAQVQALTAFEQDIAATPWELGYSSYVHLRDGRIVMTTHHGPQQRLIVLNDDGGTESMTTPFTSIKPYLASRDDDVVTVAGSSTAPAQVVAIELGAPARCSLVSSGGTPTMVDTVQPASLSVETVGGRSVNVLLYRPFGGGDNWRAPLVVRAHPGPTASMTMRLDGQVQFLVSHGFAVADVDYRGSTGYGRRFRESLFGQWGTADVDDCSAVARHFITAGNVPADQVFITGASAGGYTALQAVSRPDVFAGAVGRSAIIDPAHWQRTAPRWQRPHAAELAGPAGAVRAEAVRRPVLLIHGTTDHVAPVANVIALARDLTARGHPHDLVLLGAAGHQLGDKDDNERALDAELNFYRTCLSNPGRDAS